MYNEKGNHLKLKNVFFPVQRSEFQAITYVNHLQVNTLFVDSKG